MDETLHNHIIDFLNESNEVNGSSGFKFLTVSRNVSMLFRPNSFCYGSLDKLCEIKDKGFIVCIDIFCVGYFVKELCYSSALQTCVRKLKYFSNDTSEDIIIILVYNDYFNAPAIDKVGYVVKYT